MNAARPEKRSASPTAIATAMTIVLLMMTVDLDRRAREATAIVVHLAARDDNR